MGAQEDIYAHEESFRDSLTTVDQEGKRVWVFAKKPKGRLTNLRFWLGVFQLVVLFGLPWIRVNGQPIILLNVVERKFILFGLTFWPQDLYLVVIAFIAGVVFIALFTVVFGRVFCGWVCPQTVFMEGVFRRIEYLIEGDYMKQKALKKMGWTREKLIKRTLKHTLFFGVAFAIANLVLAYIVGTDTLIEYISEGPQAHASTFLAIVIFSIVFYWIFAFFREQVCTIVCPYGRLQGALLDKKSIVVAYDYKRGEPRGKLHKGAVQGKNGDCIDCHQCVAVCPTGIDIRHGTQMECVNCTACIDACDSIMDRINKPRGLVRYASEEGIAEGKKLRWTGRMTAYSVVLVALIGLLTSLLFLRSDVEATVLKARGQLFVTQPDGTLSNLYNVTLVNKTTEAYHLTARVLEPEGMTLRWVGNAPEIAGQSSTEGTLFLDADPEVLDGISTKVRIGFYDGERELTVTNTKFLGPIR